jgi:hypothetical protein
MQIFCSHLICKLPLNSLKKYTYRTGVGALIHLCVTRLTLILLLAKWPNIRQRQIQQKRR